MASTSTVLPFALALSLLACGAAGSETPAAVSPSKVDPGAGLEASYAPSAVEGEREVAIFAGGCFWCTESDFEYVDGVVSAVSGYIGGPESAPTYKAVSAGKTGHTEAVRIVFDPDVVTYEALVNLFWRKHDPFRKDAQFCDRGTQYRPGIFPASPAQREAAHRTKAETEEALGKAVVTEITDATTFWTAEAYHQDFFKTNPDHYLRYRAGCGRDRRIQEIWGERAK